MASLETKRSPGRDRIQRLVTVARAIGPLVAAVSAALRPLALGGAGAAVVLGLLIAEPVGSGDGGRWLVAAVVTVILLLPVGVLLVFDRALRDLRELPARLRELPDLAIAQRDELARLVGEARGDASRRPGAAIRALWSLGRALIPVRDLLLGVVPSARLLLPPFGLLAMLSVVACLVEIALAVLLVLITLIV